MILDSKILRQIDLYLEEFYPNSINAGNVMSGENLGMAQMRGFQSLVTSAVRFSEIINYIKNQTGKEKRNNTWLHVGPLLLEQLDLLEKKANELGNGNAENILEIKLKLARGWAKQVVAHCLYSNSQK